MKQKVLLFVSLLISVSVYSQTPCTSGFAGEYPCSNYDLMSRVPVSTLANSLGNPEGSDIWGWTDPTTGKEYAIAAMTNSTAFVDVSDPLSPIYLGRIDTENGGTSFWRDVKIYQNYAFIVADNLGAHGMQVFDLTRLRTVTNPETFAPDAVYSDVTSCHNIVINEANGVAYLVDCKNVGRGVHFVDISDPENPVNLGSFTGEGVTHDAQVVTYNGPDTEHAGKEILIGSNESKVVILDVTDKSNVIKIADLFYPQIGYTHQGWFTEDQRYFILGDESDEQNFGMNTRTLVFDFNDLRNPVLSSTYLGPSSAIDHNGYVKGNKFYISNNAAGLRLINIEDIANQNIFEESFFDSYPADNNAGYTGVWNVYPYFESGVIDSSDRENILFVKDPLLSVNETQDSKFVFFPNPSKDIVTIETNKNNPITSIQIVDIQGRIMYSESSIIMSSKTINLSNYSNGLYFITINNQLTKKLIKK